MSAETRYSDVYTPLSGLRLMGFYLLYLAVTGLLMLSGLLLGKVHTRNFIKLLRIDFEARNEEGKGQP